MPAVQSEAIDRVEYDSGAGTLFVRFSSGEWYAYLDAGPDVYARFMTAPSSGRFFQEEVRDRYRYVRLDVSPSS